MIILPIFTALLLHLFLKGWENGDWRRLGVVGWVWSDGGRAEVEEEGGDEETARPDFVEIFINSDVISWKVPILIT